MHTNHSTTSVNTPTHSYPYTPYIPSNPTVHFDHLSSPVLSHDHQATSLSLGGSTLSTVPRYFSYDDPERQSIRIPSDSASVGIQHSFHDNTTLPCMNTLRPNLHVGCQTSLDPPSMEVREQKKLSLPTFDPQKMSWQNFSMKLHAALINRDMEYLLTEDSTNGINHAHSKELMVELYKKL